MNLSRRLSLAVVAGVVGVGVVAFVAFVPFAHADAAPVPSACSMYASPTGSDSNPGTQSRPFLTFQKLADNLSSGVVGCLTGGVYSLPEVEAARGGTVPLVNLTKGGTAASPATMRNAPGADVRIVGRIVAKPSAANLVIAGLTLDGGPTLNDEASSLTVLADGVRLIGNTITAPTRNCVSIGSYGSNVVVVNNVVVEGNRIHHCGDDKGWGRPRSGTPHNQEHGVYVEGARSTVIQHNIIDHNDSRGVQLFTDADGTIVRNNIIDANAVAINLGGWAGKDDRGTPFGWGKAESNVIRDNIITNSSRVAFEVNWDGVTAPSGSSVNVVTANCVFGANPDRILDSRAGLAYDATNVWVDPQFNNQPAGDYRLKAVSGCIGKGVRPAVAAIVPVTVSRTSVTANAVLSPHRMTAIYSLRVRLCSNSTCTGTFSTWKSSTEASAVDVLDVTVSRTISGLVAGRSYQAQWVARQALLPMTNSAAVVVSAALVVTTAR